MRKAVVFGGSGFLGSHVADELSSRGYSVTIADVVDSKYISGSQEFIRCDIMNKECVNECVKGVDVVYNFAGLADINVAADMPLQTIELNVVGNLNILEACKNAGVKRFVYASSAYAVSNKGSFYGISKHTSEKLTEEYGSKYGLAFTIIRYGSLYGERADSSNYILSVLKEAIESKQITMVGSGEEIREYIHALDAAKLSVDVLQPEFEGQHLILTGTERIKRKDLFEMIREIFGGSVEIEAKDMEYEGHYKVTPYAFHPSSAKKLVANPYIDFGQGLIGCVKHIFESSGSAIEQ
jgi:UDP-glucose 4-epimerase